MSEKEHGIAAVNWKDSSTCIAWHCPCGHSGHYHDYFAFQLMCPNCGKIVQLPDRLELKDPEVDDYYDLVQLPQETVGAAQQAERYGYDGPMPNISGDLTMKISDARLAILAAEWFAREYPEKVERR